MIEPLKDILARCQHATARSEWQGADDRAGEEQRAVDAAAREHRLRRAQAALDPDMWRAITAAQYDPGRAKAGRTVLAWLGTRGAAYPVLGLQGGAGVGKSTAACWWIANRSGGGHVRGATAIATAWSSSSVRASEDREWLCQCGALVLDDVGTEIRQHAEGMGAALRELLERRQGLRTIVTTNLSRDAWALRYPDARIASRMARVAWVVCTGQDMRTRPPEAAT